MSRSRIAALVLGVGILVALAWYSGLPSVGNALRALGLRGLVVVSLVHVPVAIAMGYAWSRVATWGDGRSWLNFAWARLVRDAGAEVLPFSQLGGFVLGVRALHIEGISGLGGALAMCVDLVLEMWAKIPYFALGLLALFVGTGHASALDALLPALGLTTVVALASLAFAPRLRATFETVAARLARRWPEAMSPTDVEAFFDVVLEKKSRLFACFAIHFLCWLIGAAEMMLLLTLMQLPASWIEALALDSLVSGLRTFAFLIPAAAGVQEASYVLVGAFFGLAPGTAIAISLIRRAREFVLGVPVLAVWQYREMKPRLDYRR